jgi:transcriptional regulator with XRE-family HTH domain
LAQCVIEARGGQLRIERADGRGSQVRGAMLPYRLERDELQVDSTSVASLLGRGLRAIRHERGWSQAHVAEMVGVSGSAISQAERGQHALSLETVLDLADKMGVSIDHLLRGRPPAYELARFDGVAQTTGRQSRQLIDDESLRLRTVVTRIPPRGAASPILRPSNTQLLLVGTGLVRVMLPSASPILRQGDALTVRSGGVSGCRNLGDDEAVVFWHEFGSYDAG